LTVHGIVSEKVRRGPRFVDLGAHSLKIVMETPIDA
jgi:hypothetical protein